MFGQRPLGVSSDLVVHPRKQVDAQPYYSNHCEQPSELEKGPARIDEPTDDSELPGLSNFSPHTLRSRHAHHDKLADSDCANSFADFRDCPVWERNRRVHRV